MAGRSEKKRSEREKSVGFYYSLGALLCAVAWIVRNVVFPKGGVAVDIRTLAWRAVVIAVPYGFSVSSILGSLRLGLEFSLSNDLFFLTTFVCLLSLLSDRAYHVFWVLPAFGLFKVLRLVYNWALTPEPEPEAPSKKAAKGEKVKHKYRTIRAQGDLDGAIDVWFKGLRALQFVLSRKAEFKRDITSQEDFQKKWDYFVQYYVELCLNMSLALMKKGDYEGCIKYCNDTLQYDRVNLKAFLRITHANAELGHFDRALRHCGEGLAAHPGNAELKALKKKVLAMASAHDRSQKGIMQGIFKRMDHDPRSVDGPWESMAAKALLKAASLAWRARSQVLKLLGEFARVLFGDFVVKLLRARPCRTAGAAHGGGPEAYGESQDLLAALGVEGAGEDGHPLALAALQAAGVGVNHDLRQRCRGKVEPTFGMMTLSSSMKWSETLGPISWTKSRTWAELELGAGRDEFPLVLAPHVYLAHQDQGENANLAQEPGKRVEVAQVDVVEEGKDAEAAGDDDGHLLCVAAQVQTQQQPVAEVEERRDDHEHEDLVARHHVGALQLDDGGLERLLAVVLGQRLGDAVQRAPEGEKGEGQQAVAKEHHGLLDEEQSRGVHGLPQQPHLLVVQKAGAQHLLVARELPDEGLGALGVSVLPEDLGENLAQLKGLVDGDHTALRRVQAAAQVDPALDVLVGSSDHAVVQTLFDLSQDAIHDRVAVDLELLHVALGNGDGSAVVDGGVGVDAATVTVGKPHGENHNVLGAGQQVGAVVRAALGKNCDGVTVPQSSGDRVVSVRKVDFGEDLKFSVWRRIKAYPKFLARVLVLARAGYGTLQGQLGVGVDGDDVELLAAEVELVAGVEVQGEVRVDAAHGGVVILPDDGAHASVLEVLLALHGYAAGEAGQSANEAPRQGLGSHEEADLPRDGVNQRGRVDELVVVVAHEDHGPEERQPLLVDDGHVHEERVDDHAAQPFYEHVEVEDPEVGRGDLHLGRRRQSRSTKAVGRSRTFHISCFTP
ncbi:tetratricopeptide repeat containing domain protein [Babesia caballi]|uniref:peptidylprolyl isomerase n=1 Tax=Babesia caballi TaxID=5871 RepID=A0AAV4M2M3_BABCB|nr:tetratricopeptide repeat containing domain protein [Babesia caballi]